MKVSQLLLPASGSAAANGGQTVVYWMTREQRVEDNWSLLYAQQLAQEHHAQLRVIFSLVPKYLEATERQYGFMMAGLAEVEKELIALNIPFEVLIGPAWQTLPAYTNNHATGAVVTDFGPLRIGKEWTNKTASTLGSAPLFVVDGHNIVPVWIASDKLEYAARTIRPKIHKHLKHFLTEFPRVKSQLPMVAEAQRPPKIDWVALDSTLEIDRRVKAVAGIKPGTAAGLETLHGFIRARLAGFATKRNDPNAKHLSGMSPYLHFGQVAPQRCVLEVNKFRARYNESVNSFVEELVVRRELSDNHCWYNPKYDSIDGASGWAKETLLKHAVDKRPFLYSLGEFEFAVTYDSLWNAAQLQMIHEGKMHGFLRMYWAKKILEWSPSPQQALATAIYLNDRYNLDGRDPNGYVGCAWSIIGTHDMGWAERPIFGKIRYMNFDGCKRKFNVAGFVSEWARQGSVSDSVPWRQNKIKAKERDQELAKKEKANGGGNAAAAASSSGAAAAAAASSDAAAAAAPAAAAPSPTTAAVAAAAPTKSTRAKRG